MSKERKVILYIATSLDGYIAKPNDDLSFLSIVEKEGEDYGYADFIKTVDTVILGRKTYDWIMKQVPEYVHADKVTYVITRTEQPAIENTKFYTGDLSDLLLKLKHEEGRNIFIDGGAQIVNELLRLKLIDEFIISVIPVMVGDGIRLFQEQIPELYLELYDVKHFDTGLVQLYYKRVEN